MLGKKTGGRVKGSKNKTTREIHEIASIHGPKAVQRLAWLLENAESHQTQAFAAERLLDRAYGKPSQPVEAGEDLLDALRAIKVTFGT